MKKTSKMIIGGLVAVTAIGAVLLSSSDLFQGRISQRSISQERECPTIQSNFDPNSGIVTKYGTAVNFKWNGPGCSKYEFSQFLLCFENLENSQEYACIYPGKTNTYTLTPADWKTIDTAMKTKSARYKTATKWYVQSRFGDANKGEILNTKAWDFAYSTYGRKK